MENYIVCYHLGIEVICLGRGPSAIQAFTTAPLRQAGLNLLFQLTKKDRVGQSGRDFVLPTRDTQVKDAEDFELITWVVIRGG